MNKKNYKDYEIKYIYTEVEKIRKKIVVTLNQGYDNFDWSRYLFGCDMDLYHYIAFKTLQGLEKDDSIKEYIRYICYWTKT